MVIQINNYLFILNLHVDYLGVDCTLSRMRHLVTFHISGTDISDVTLLLISQHLVSLNDLDISFCIKVTNKGLAHLADKKSVVKSTLIDLDMSSCKQVGVLCPKYYLLNLQGYLPACGKAPPLLFNLFSVSYVYSYLVQQFAKHHF